MDNTRLTDEQIKNWRNVLIAMLGPYALIMSADEIQNIHDETQAILNKAATRRPEDSEGAKGE